MDGWDVARDIAIIILVIQGCVVFLALFVGGVVGSIAIIETTVKIKQGLRRTARSTERVQDTVETTARQRVLPSIVQIERVRAAVESYAESLQEELRKARGGVDTPSKA
ncbi:MAG: hypothetical protein OXG79_10925 [Chloroflexi bacterium]|nr:hypothetical protein [Chloroflexota bacterium]MCY4110914.1 hypothetical protein [Chloroflexota bacterium]